MTISVDWGTRTITVHKSDMDLIQSEPFEVYELDLNEFRLTLKGLEESDDGMIFPDTHSHNTEAVLSGVTFARVIQIINGYTITFEDGQYAVNAVGANSNLADVMNLNQVSLRSFNSAGLQVVTQGSSITEQDKTDIANNVWSRNISTQPSGAGLNLMTVFRILQNPSVIDKVLSELRILDETDGVTPIMRWPLTNSQGGPITVPAGAASTKGKRTL